MPPWTAPRLGRPFQDGVDTTALPLRLRSWVALYTMSRPDLNRDLTVDLNRYRELRLHGPEKNPACEAASEVSV